VNRSRRFQFPIQRRSGEFPVSSGRIGNRKLQEPIEIQQKFSYRSKTFNLGFVGSNPTGLTINPIIYNLFYDAFRNDLFTAHRAKDLSPDNRIIRLAVLGR
jgi:hypothetical protein